MDSKRNILLITPVYPGENVHKSTTPVVHYFTREWIKMGYNVRVIHFPVNFPKLVYMLASPFRDRIGTIMGSEIRTWPLREQEYLWEGVPVKRIPLTKSRPHCRYSSKQIDYAVRKTIEYCDTTSFCPDVIIAHWVNPTLEILNFLKNHYNTITCFVSHDIGWDLDSIYKNEAKKYLSNTDVLGYRSDYIKKCFEEKYKCSGKYNFLAYSGIPSSYIENVNRKLNSVNKFIFVGTLLKRKFPSVIVSAVAKAFRDNSFSITYIGFGDETKKVEQLSKRYRVEQNVHLLGFMSREKVVEYLDRSDVFVMISKDETFGLVYLEAMARGCITIASRNEGFDGIIKDGLNGFLCEAGNEQELISIILKLRNMSKEQLTMISQNAIKTAKELTDVKVAKNYINAVMKVVKQ